MLQRTITLEPITHTYTDEVSQIYTSVTTLIGKFYEDFDDSYWSYYKAYQALNVKVLPNPDDRKLGFKQESFFGGTNLVDWKSIDEVITTCSIEIHEQAELIKANWNVENTMALVWGTKTHDRLEFGVNSFYPKRSDCTYALRDGLNLNHANAFVSHDDLLDSDINTAFPTIFNYLYNLITDGFVIFTEVLIYHPDENYLVCGKADIVAVRNKEVIIADWKTNKKPLSKISGYFKKRRDYKTNKVYYTDEFYETNKRMFAPVNNLPDSDYWHYSLQLNMYGYLISLFGFKILKYELWHLVPLYSNDGELIDLGGGERLLGTPKYYQLPNLQHEVKALIETTLN